MSADTEAAEFISLLAERPDDRSLRLVFSDWLQEKGDPRGEAIALWERGAPSPVERRKLVRLAVRHAREWLGEALFGAVELNRCEWAGGFPVTLGLRDDLLAPYWGTITPEPRLSTVRRLTVHRATKSDPKGFFFQPALRWLRSLVVPSAIARALAGQPLNLPALESVGLSGWGLFADELARLSAVEAFARTRRLELWTAELINPEAVRELWRSLRAQRADVEAHRELLLGVEFATMEGQAAWLLPSRHREWIERDWQPDRLIVRAAEVGYELVRDAKGLLSTLRIDADGPKGAEGLGRRLAEASAVLVQLADAELTNVELVLPHGARLEKDDRNALRSAIRRLRTVTHFEVQGQPVSP